MSRCGILCEPVLVGRERELEALEAFLSLAFEGKGRTVFVSGEAGSGKTRLSREFLNAARKKGILVMPGWCLSDAEIPYFPFIEAFNGFFSSVEEEEQPSDSPTIGFQSGTMGATQVRSDELEITKWLSAPARRLGVSEAFSPQVWKDQAFAAIAKTLNAISAQVPIVLFIEDIHWADSASLALLHYIARTVHNSERVLLLATFRSEELTADAEGHPHPLAEALRIMGREDLFFEIKLSDLDQANVTKIAESMIGASLQAAFAEKLAKDSRGNALFVVESLRMLSEHKSLVKQKDEWRLAVDELGIPSKIKDILLHRLGALNHAQRKVLETACVVGEKFNVEFLSSVLGQDSLDVLQTLDAIARSTALVIAEESYYRFDHARSRETLYQELSPPLKRGYHARIADKLESLGKGGKLSVADLAYHYSQAGNEEKAIKFSLAAGQEALARCSNKEAIKSFQYVIQKLSDKSERFAEETAALEGLGDALYANNNFRESMETFEQLAMIQKGKDKLRALRKAIVAAFYHNNVPKIKELTQVAEGNAAADRLEAARILSHKARARGLEFEVSYCWKVLNEAISIYEEEYALSDAAWDLFVVSFLAPQFGEVEKGVASALRSIALYEELGDVHSQLEAHLYAGNCFTSCALNEEAAKFYSRIIEIDNRFKLNDYTRLIPAFIYLGMNLFWRDPKQAKAMGLKALEYCDKLDLKYGIVYEFLTFESMVNGDIVRGEEYFRKLMSLHQNILGSAITLIFLELTKAVYFAGKNQFDEARKCFDKHLAFVKANMPSPGMEAGAKLFYSWILNKEDRVEEAKAMRQQVQVLREEAQKRFAHVNVHTCLITFIHPEVNQTFEIRLDVVNVSRTEGSIVRVENLLVPPLKIVDISPNCLLKEGYLEFKNNKIKPFEVKTIKLTVAASKPGAFTITPAVTYLDDLGQTKTSSTRQFTITVQAAKPSFEVQPGRITTGYPELDGLLGGGIPEGYAVGLVAPSCDERQLLISRFLEAGVGAGEPAIYVTCEAGNVQAFTKQSPASFNALVCNPQADLMVQNLSNVYKVKGLDSLTEIEIALTKYYRTLDPTQTGLKRACIDLVSDVLLQYHAVTTRKWLNGILIGLKAKGFTTLAVINPQMHPPEESQAIRSLFDGEIEITENGSAKTLRVRRLVNQRYLDNEIALTKKNSLS